MVRTPNRHINNIEFVDADWKVFGRGFDSLHLHQISFMEEWYLGGCPGFDRQMEGQKRVHLNINANDDVYALAA